MSSGQSDCIAGLLDPRTGGVAAHEVWPSLAQGTSVRVDARLHTPTVRAATPVERAVRSVPLR